MSAPDNKLNRSRRSFLKFLIVSIGGVFVSSCQFLQRKTKLSPTKTPFPEVTNSNTPSPTNTSTPTKVPTQTPIHTATATQDYCKNGIINDLNHLVASLAEQNTLYQNENGEYPFSDGTLYMDVGDWEVEINNQLLGYLEQCNLELVLLEKFDNEDRLFEITNQDGSLILNTRSAPLSGPNQRESEYSIAFTGGIGREFHLAVLIQGNWIIIEGSEIAFGFMVVNPTKTPGKNGGSTSDTSDTSNWSDWSEQ